MLLTAVVGLAISTGLVWLREQAEAAQGQAHSRHQSLNILFRKLGERGDESAYRSALRMLEELADEFPSEPQYRADLARRQDDLVNLLLGLGKHGEAEAAYRDALKTWQRLANDFPKVPYGYRLELAISHYNLAKLLRDRGKRAEAEVSHRAGLEIQEQVVMEFPTATDCYKQACGVCRHIEWFEEHSSRPNIPERSMHRQAYADVALAFLRQAVAKGFQDAAQMKKDTSLDPLRSHPEFQKLLQELEAKAQQGGAQEP